MHLGNGAVTPACAVYVLAVAAVGMGVGAILARMTRAPEPKQFALVTSLIFAAQTFNVPIIPAASGHVLGGFLLASLFGGAWGAISMTLILALQSIVFSDGGLMTLGCNVFNMAILPCLVVYPLWKLLFRDAIGRPLSITTASGAFVSVMLASVACAVEVLSQPEARADEMRILGWMLGVHAVIGAIEAIFTVLALAWLSRKLGAVPGIVGVIALIVSAGFCASPWPDGLEFTLSRFNLNEGHASGLLTDYTLLTTLLATAALAGCAAAFSATSRKLENHA